MEVPQPLPPCMVPSPPLEIQQLLLSYQLASPAANLDALLFQ